MTIFTDGLRQSSGVGIHKLGVSLGQSLGATVDDAIESMPVVSIARIGELSAAQGQVPDFGGPISPEVTDIFTTQPEIPIGDAWQRTKEAGLENQIHLPAAPTMKAAALDIMIERARARRERETTLSRGPAGFIPGALGVGTSFLVGALDPLNIASAFIPVMGEARYAKLLADAGTSFVPRAAVRTGVGAASGVVGQAAVEPFEAWARTQEGRDYTYANALHSLLFGAVFGGGLHFTGGAIADTYRSRTGKPLFPFAPGEPHFQSVPGLGTHVPGNVLAEGGVTAEQLQAPAPMSAWDSHVATFDDLPPRAKEDLLRGAIGRLHEGEPVSAVEQLLAAAKTDPRIAESIEAWHGSPHDFDQFDLSRIGTGEGAQSYGHGLYLAEHRDVAAGYRATTTYADFQRKVRELYDEFETPGEAHELVSESKQFTASQRELLKALEQDDWLGFDYPHQAVAAAIKEPGAFELSDRTKAALDNLGNLYKVRIKADQDHFLHWNKPLSEQPRALAAFERAWAETGEPAENWKVMTGEQAYDRLATLDGGDGASQHLREVGIPGIKYLDKGSRNPASDLALAQEALARARSRIAEVEREIADNKGNAGLTERFFKAREAELKELRAHEARVLAAIADELGGKAKTHNFVVFDDKLIEITDKNGMPVRHEDTMPARAPAEAVPAGRSANRVNGTNVGFGSSSMKAYRETLGRQAEVDWHELADRPREFDDPDSLAASQAAQNEPAPASVSPEPNKRIQAAEAAQAAAEAEYRDAEPFLPEDLKARVEHDLAALEADLADRTEVIRRGAACLAAVAGGAA